MKNRDVVPMSPDEVTELLGGYQSRDNVPEAVEGELRAALQQVADTQGPDALVLMAVNLVLPIEERVRREQPDHPVLPVIDEMRATGKL